MDFLDIWSFYKESKEFWSFKYLFYFRMIIIEFLELSNFFGNMISILYTLVIALILVNCISYIWNCKIVCILGIIIDGKSMKYVRLSLQNWKKIWLLTGFELGTFWLQVGCSVTSAILPRNEKCRKIEFIKEIGNLSPSLSPFPTEGIWKFFLCSLYTY